METIRESISVLNIVVWKGPTKKATSEQEVEGEKGVSHVYSGGKSCTRQRGQWDRGVLRWEVAVMFQTKLMVTAHRRSASCRLDTVLKALHPLSQLVVHISPAPIYRWRNEGTNSLDSLPKITQLESGEPGSLAPEPGCSTTLLCRLVFHPLEMQTALPVTLQRANLHSGGSIFLILILALVVLVLSHWFISI